MSRNDLVAMIVLLSIGSVTLITLVTSFLRYRTQVAARPGANLSEQRLARIEQAVEAIAVEVERIGEAQRFNAKLMAEGRRPLDALPAATYQEGRSRG